jgi:hypothetical protein
MDQRSNILILRIIAVIIVVTTLVACMAQLRARPDIDATAALTALGVFGMSVGISAILIGIAALLQQRQKPGEPGPADTARNQLIELAMKMQDLGTSIDRLSRPGVAPPVQVAPGAGGDEAGEQSRNVIAALQRLLEELRDLSLLPDEQRRIRWQQMQETRKTLAIQSAAAMIQDRQWIGAEQAITAIEQEWPEHAQVAALRKELDAARADSEAEAIQIGQSRIETEMSLSHWEEAHQLALKLAAEFPNSAAAINLLSRVEREKGIYTETTVQRLYEEIRHDVDRRIWRRAMGHAQMLLARFPQHPRSELMRKQIHTIQNNAEIEERQEQETRIGELIRARRFSEAVHLAEELLRSFPTSPQAEAIQKILPRIQELAADEVAQTPQE